MQYGWLVAACLWPIAAASQTESKLPREVLALARIKQKMTERLSRMPDYTCLETINRFARPSGAHRFKPVDTVRLEVAHVGGNEVYSWPGDHAFQDTTAAALVAVGTISSGEFAAHARSVFMSGATGIVYRGEEDLNGRKTLRYDFRVPLLFTRWMIHIGGKSGAAASRGSFWADAASFDLLRLEAHADEIPPDIPVTEVTTIIDYAPVRIGGGSVWLPQNAQASMTDISGRQTRNHLEFSHCRQFRGESVISFSEPASAPAAAARPLTEIKLPPRLALSVALETEIDSSRSQVGDVIAAKLLSDAAERGGLVVPKGAVLHGRIRRLEKYSDPMPHYLLGLEFSDLEFDGRRAQFFGRLEQIGPAPGLEYFLTTSRVARSGDRQYRRETVTETLRPADLPGVGTFFMRGAAFRLAAGLRMTWRTLDPGR